MLVMHTFMSACSLTTAVMMSLSLRTPYEMQPGIAHLSFITLPLVHLLLQSVQSPLILFRTVLRNGLPGLLDCRNGTLLLMQWFSNAKSFSSTMLRVHLVLDFRIPSAMTMLEWELWASMCGRKIVCVRSKRKAIWNLVAMLLIQ